MLQQVLSAGIGRWVLACLLLVAAAVYVAGVSVERTRSDQHMESVPSETHGEAPVRQFVFQLEETEELFGVDTESTPVVAVAVAIAVVLALAALIVRSPAVLLVILLFGLGAMAFDIREALHQADESRTSVVALASVTAALHFAVALAALGMAATGRGARTA